jgi:adenosylcobinamide-GDP ribazoletransferase
VALLLAHSGGRAVMPWLMYSLPPARPGGLGAGAGQPDGKTVLLTLLPVALATLLLLPAGRAGLLCAVTALVCLVVRHIARQRLGGFTGDVAGALEQLTETVILLACAAGSVP